MNGLLAKIYFIFCIQNLFRTPLHFIKSKPIESNRIESQIYVDDRCWSIGQQLVKKKKSNNNI